MTLIRRPAAVLLAAVAVPASLLAGCSTASADVTAESARSDALSLLERTVRSTSLEWSSPGNPTKLPCSNGARLRYMIHAPITAEPRAVADELAGKWRADGLRVERSEQDFGSEYGTVYAATARADGAASAAFEITDSTTLVYIRSVCIPGESDDE